MRQRSCQAAACGFHSKAEKQALGNYRNRLQAPRVLGRRSAFDLERGGHPERGSRHADEVKDCENVSHRGVAGCSKKCVKKTDTPSVFRKLPPVFLILARDAAVRQSRYRRYNVSGDEAGRSTIERFYRR
jgi:hypothetical protein